MRATFITDEATQDIGEAVALALESRLTALELRSVWGSHVVDLSQPKKRQLRDTIAAADLQICCIDSFVMKCDVSAPLPLELEKAKKAIELAVFLSSPRVRVFSFWREEPLHEFEDRVIEAMMRIGEVAKGTGVRLLVENGKRTMHSSGVELAGLMSKLDGKIFGALWDPGNSLLAGADPDPLHYGFPAIAKYIEHVHIKDPLIRPGIRRYTELGKGDLNIEGHMRALREVSYNGYISLETHYRPNRLLADGELDLPGGQEFSGDGLSVTRVCLSKLRAAISDADLCS